MEENEKVIVKEIVRIEEPQVVKAEVVNQVETKSVELPFGFYSMMFFQIALTSFIAWQMYHGFNITLF